MIRTRPYISYHKHSQAMCQSNDILTTLVCVGHLKFSGLNPGFPLL